MKEAWSDRLAQVARVWRGTVQDTWLTDAFTASEVVGGDEVELEGLREASCPLLHVQCLEAAELLLDLGGGTVQLPVELLELRLRDVRNLAPLAVWTAKLDFPDGGLGRMTLSQVHEERAT